MQNQESSLWKTICDLLTGLQERIVFLVYIRFMFGFGLSIVQLQCSFWRGCQHFAQERHHVCLTTIRRPNCIHVSGAGDCSFFQPFCDFSSELCDRMSIPRQSSVPPTVLRATTRISYSISLKTKAMPRAYPWRFRGSASD